MNARTTFGRKGASEAGGSPRRAALLGLNRAQDFAPSAAPAGPEDEATSRREAFLAAERARAGDLSPTQAMPVASEEAIRAILCVDAPPPPTDRSIRIAYALWFLTGLFGGHRFYLRRPLLGAVQAVIFFGCVAAAVLQYYWAFAELAVSWLWMLADGIRLKHLHSWSGRE